MCFLWIGDWRLWSRYNSEVKKRQPFRGLIRSKKFAMCEETPQNAGGFTETISFIKVIMDHHGTLCIIMVRHTEWDYVTCICRNMATWYKTNYCNPSTPSRVFAIQGSQHPWQFDLSIEKLVTFGITKNWAEKLRTCPHNKLRVTMGYIFLPETTGILAQNKTWDLWPSRSSPKVSVPIK